MKLQRNILAIIRPLVLFGLSLPLLALETDNYITWDIELQDSTEVINSYVNQQIDEELNLRNKQEKKINCHDLTLKIAMRFKTKPPVKHPLEDYLADHLGEEMIYPKEHKYRLQSIYQDPFRFYLKYVKLAPSVQVNGVYLGTDKLSHFVSTGRRYYEHYTKKMKKGLSPQEALESAIRFGLKNEKTFLGTWSSGVFSYADMEANYQGLRFYQSMCAGTQPYLAYSPDKKSWERIRNFNVSQYVNPYWDETFNLSYRLARNWKKTSKTLQSMYCDKFQSPHVQERFSYYKNWNHQSASLDYIQKLRGQVHKLAPNPYKKQSFTKLCGQL